MLLAVTPAALLWPMKARCDAPTSPAAPVRVCWTASLRNAPGDSRPTALVRINSEAAETFLIDTGAPRSLIGTAAANRLRLNKSGDSGTVYKVNGADAIEVDAGRFQIGDLPALRHFKLLTVDNSALERSLDQRVDGVIGADLLSQCAVAFDFGAHLVSLYYPGGMTQDEVRAAGFEDDQTTDTHLSETVGLPLYYVSVGLTSGNRQTTELVRLDTGSNATIIGFDAAQELALKPFPEKMEALTLNGTVSTRKAIVDQISLQDIQWPNQAVIYPEFEIPGYPVCLGMDTLGGCKMLLDFSQHTAYFTPSQSH